MIFIDLTDLELWDGIHGGTQRVVYGIAKELATANDVGFIAFSPRWDRFVPTRFEPIVERVENHGTEAPAPPADDVYRAARRLRRLLPRSVRASPRARAVGAHALGLARRAANRLARRSRSDADPPVGVDFAPEDVVLVLGKPWDAPALQDRLDAERERVGFRVVELVYDMVIPLHPHLHHPDLFAPYTRQMFLQAQGSDRLLAISESSKRDFETFCDRLALTCPPIDVIRLADRFESPDAVAVAVDDPLPPEVSDDFVLCVGTVEVRKNHMLLYQAYKLAAERGIDLPQLVIVGSRGWLVDDVWNLLTRDPAVRGSILVLTGIDDATLVNLYRRSRGTVYPSKYEGWGLPVAESLAHGVPCVASHASSIREIGGDLVRYFSPYSVEECLDAIIWLTDPAERDAASRSIAAQYIATSWSDTAAAVRESIARL